MSASYRLEPLSEKHSVDQFGCGDSDIDEYLHTDALQQMAYGQARTFVEIDTQKPAAIAGFFTLRAHSLQIEADYFDYLDDEPEGSTIEVPLAELMYLARDLSWKGSGMGPTLMIDAIKVVAEVAERIGIIGLHLRTTPEGERLYQDFDFKQFVAHPLRDRARYILPIRDVRAIAAAAI